MVGSTARPLRRSGAKPGDSVWVTGRLGGAGLALNLFLAGGQPLGETRAKLAAPRARIREAQWLASHGATACIDISDGLVADVAHIAAASGVRIAIDINRIVCAPGATPEGAASSGEEYELIVTASSAFDADLFAREFGQPLTNIGVVAAGPAGVDVSNAGQPVSNAAGFNHFTR